MRPLARNAVLVAMLALAVSIGPAARASADFGTGVGNLSAPFDGSEQQAEIWFDRAERLGAELFRVEVTWASLAPVRPIDPADPAAYDFSVLRTYVERAQAHGLEVMFTIWNAPDWAEGPGRPGWAPPGSWKPNARAFGEFATALTEAFDGFSGPRVRFYEVWNEPNLSLFLTPQWKNGETIVSAVHYRRMLNAFYASAKLTNPMNQIIAAGVAPHGEDIGSGIDPTSGRRTRPIQFYRRLMCLARHENRPIRCPVKPRFDIAGIHPISRDAPPEQQPNDPDDLRPVNVGSVAAALHAAERARRVVPSGAGVHRDLWATEIWIETSPPDAVNGVPIPEAGVRLARTLQLLSEGGVSRAINYVIRDQSPGTDGSGGEAFHVQGGIWHHPDVRGGDVKTPLFNAFRFPFVADRAGPERIEVWGRTPRGGELRIERRGGRAWRLVKAMRVEPWQVFKASPPLPAGTHQLRARVRGTKSGLWRVGAG